MLKCKYCGGDTALVGNDYVCHDCHKWVGKRCEVYSRGVGYLRPVNQWNRGKKQEFKDRKYYKV